MDRADVEKAALEQRIESLKSCMTEMRDEVGLHIIMHIIMHIMITTRVNVNDREAVRGGYT